MGFLGRLFGKKDDDFNFDQPGPNPIDTSQDPLGMVEQPVLPDTPEPSGLPPHLDEPQLNSPAPKTTDQPGTINQPGTSQRDLELISSKLDTLKAILNSMDQRIANLEKAAGVEQKKMPW